MSQDEEEVIRKGAFQKVAFSSAKKFTCNDGQLTLTSERLLIDCKGFWSRSFSIRDINLEAGDKNIEVHDSWYGKLLFRLIVDDAEEWVKAFRKTTDLLGRMQAYWERWKKMPKELNELFEVKPETLRKIYEEIRKERLRFGQKNIEFILTVQGLIETTHNRKLKAFILAHCYIAWYEWTKNLLSKIYKGKFGKGPRDDEELIRFLGSFPSLGVLDTMEWGINANQIRNCVAHERFYYDYKHSELVLTVENKERKIRLRELQWRFFSIAHTYQTLIQSLKQKVQMGKIHYESDFLD